MHDNVLTIESAPIQLTKTGSVVSPAEPPASQQTTVISQNAQYAFFGTRIRQTIEDLKS